MATRTVHGPNNNGSMRSCTNGCGEVWCQTINIGHNCHGKIAMATPYPMYSGRIWEIGHKPGVHCVSHKKKLESVMLVLHSSTITINRPIILDIRPPQAGIQWADRPSTPGEIPYYLGFFLFQKCHTDTCFWHLIINHQSKPPLWQTNQAAHLCKCHKCCSLHAQAFTVNKYKISHLMSGTQADAIHILVLVHQDPSE
jgi:hypothetical protein